MEICKSVEVYSVTRLYPLHLQLHPTIILLLSIAAKKEAKKKGEKKEALSLLFFRAHFKICFFFLSISFLPLKLSFCFRIAPWTDGRAEVCVDLFFFFLSVPVHYQ